MALLLRCPAINNADAIRLRSTHKLRFLREFMWFISLPWVHIAYGDAEKSLSAPKTAAEFLVVLTKSNFDKLELRDLLDDTWGLDFGLPDGDGRLVTWPEPTVVAALVSIACWCPHFFS